MANRILNWLQLHKTSLMNWIYILGFIVAVNGGFVLEYLLVTTGLGLIIYWKELNKIWRFGANMYYNFNYNTYRKLAKIKGKRKDVDLFDKSKR